MEFWGIEVKAKPVNVELEPGHCIHISQATLGELKKDNEPVTVHVKVGDKKFVLGFLSQNSPQLSFDLAFNDSFEISHNWKNGSVHLLGYQSDMQDDLTSLTCISAGATEEDDFDSSDEDMPMPIPLENGKAASAKAAEKQNKDNKPKVEVKPENEDEDDSEDDDSEDDDDSDADMLEGSDDSDEQEGSEDDDEDDSEDETPAKAEVGKKRKPDAKTPEPKKAKLATPQKTDGKKGGHTATPHPAKKGGKTPGGDKSTPKGGQVSCGSCKKTFNSEVGLQAHSKAKHSGK